MPHYTFNFQDTFRETVMEKFVRSYESGLTPSPCIDCNRYLKFGAMLQRARELGCQYVVTGHYAQIRQSSETGRYLLYKAADKAKDQTYFLYPLTQEMLSHTLFPLGRLTKAQVREIAAEHGFVTGDIAVYLEGIEVECQYFEHSDCRFEQHILAKLRKTALFSL